MGRGSTSSRFSHAPILRDGLQGLFASTAPGCGVAAPAGAVTRLWPGGAPRERRVASPLGGSGGAQRPPEAGFAYDVEGSERSDGTLYVAALVMLKLFFGMAFMPIHTQAPTQNIIQAIAK